MQPTLRRWEGVRRPGGHLWRSFLGGMVACLCLVSCTSRSVVPPAPPPAPGSPPSPTATHIEYGTASWYGKERQGRRTASGEVYDSEQLTAAHRTATFGVQALVTNLANGRKAWVRINDRGPALASRVLDVSYAAARQLDMVRTGVARVKIEFFTQGL